MSESSGRRVFLKQLLASGAVAWVAGKEIFGQKLQSDYANPVSFIAKPFELDRKDFEINPALSPQNVFR